MKVHDAEALREAIKLTRWAVYLEVSGAMVRLSKREALRFVKQVTRSRGEVLASVRPTSSGSMVTLYSHEHKEYTRE